MAKKETRGWVKGTRRTISERILTRNMVADWRKQETKISLNVASRVEKYMLSEVGVNGSLNFAKPCPTNIGEMMGIINVGGNTYLVSETARHSFGELDSTSAINIADSVLSYKE